MANSRYEYVKQFERENHLLQDTYIIIRVDGKSFHKFSKYYNFEKPNDEWALEVMNQTARKIMEKYDDILMAYGDSDEYSFLLKKNCQLYERREMKLITLFSSLMSSYYIYYWQLERKLDIDHMPLFDARAILYPNYKLVRDYFSWRQVDCHVNNLYNTTFWNLVIKCDMTPQQAEQRLMGTVSSDKHEILFKQCGINYNNEPEMFKKGTILVRQIENGTIPVTTRDREKMDKKLKKTNKIVKYHCDIINDQWWEDKPWLQ